MSGLELVAVAPVVALAWLLKQKVSSQQQLIENHEIVISKQQQLLEDLTGHDSTSNSTSNKMIEYIECSKRRKAIAIIGLALLGLWKAKSFIITQSKMKSIPPPSDYVPTPTKIESEMCNVCYENRKDTLFAPCRHFSTCWQCAQSLRNGCCPVCREPIEAIQYVYMT